MDRGEAVMTRTTKALGLALAAGLVLVVCASAAVLPLRLVAQDSTSCDAPNADAIWYNGLATSPIPPGNGNWGSNTLVAIGG
jgi:hypothetical protein